MTAIELHRPQTVAEAISLLAEDQSARPLAGGASMVAMINARLLAPTAIVSLRDVDELRGIVVGQDGIVRIGAMTLHRQTAECADLVGTLACIRAAAQNIANPPIRNMGTMGGSISLADPAADYPPALVAVGATIEIAGKEGTRQVLAKDFFVDWYGTALEPGELVTAIVLPKPRSGSSSYYKLARIAGDFAIISVGISADTEHVSVAVGGCGPTPVADEEANGLLSGGLSNAASVKAAGEILVRRSDPVDDVRATASYRRLVLPRLLARAAAETSRALEGAT